MKTTFTVAKLDLLRTKASDVCEVLEEGPKGWSKSEVDPMQLLTVFRSLRIRNAFILRAYQYRSGGNGNGIVWAMPKDTDFPEPEMCPKLTDYFLKPPKPPGALDDFMEAISGDGSSWSYISASLFQRECSELGAIWHGCSWVEHGIVGKKPSKRDFKGWEWFEPEPKRWQPEVSQSEGSVQVTFFTISYLGSASIYRHIDTFDLDKYTFTTNTTTIAGGRGGFVH